MEAVRSSREDPPRRLSGDSAKHMMPFATDALVVRDGSMAAQQVVADHVGGVVRRKPSPSREDTWSDVTNEEVQMMTNNRARGTSTTWRRRR
jgi:hypothetical protein